MAAQNAAAGPLPPPPHVKLRKGDQPFWDAIIAARARDTWTEVDLAHAANLAACLCDIERLKAELAKEDDIVTRQNGSLAINPKHILIEKLSARAASLARLVHVHATATIGPSQDAAKTLRTEKAAKAAQIDDDLIPKIRAIK